MSLGKVARAKALHHLCFFLIPSAPLLFYFLSLSFDSFFLSLYRVLFLLSLALSSSQVSTQLSYL